MNDIKENLMDKIISKEEAVAMLVRRYAVDSTDRLHIESACAVIYEWGYRDGVLYAAEQVKLNTGISPAGIGDQRNNNLEKDMEDYGPELAGDK